MENPQIEQNNQVGNAEEIRLSDLILNIKKYFSYVISKWWLILLFGIVSGVLGWLYAYYQDEDYISEATFIIDSDAASSSFASSLMTLAGSFGLGGSAAGEGFSNELLHGIIKSRRVIKSALLAKYNVDGIEDHLAHHYIRLYPDYAEEVKITDFRLENDSLHHLNPYEDSVLNVMYLELLANNMTVEYMEEIAMNKLIVRSLSRDFSLNFCEFLLSTASDFFIQSAVRKESKSLEIAERQSDSLFNLLKGKENRLASLTDESGYKFMARGFVEEGRLIRDIEVLSEMYGESYASLELARYTLEDKKPIIEVVDHPYFSTYREDIKIVAIAIIASVIGLFLAIIFFILRKLIIDILAEEEEPEGLEAAPSEHTDVTDQPL